jgi:hypothetical protein
MKLGRIASGGAALSLLISALPLQAQVGGQSGQSQPGSGNQLNRQGVRLQPRQQRKNYLAELKIITEALAKSANSKVVVDPALFVPAAPKAPASELSLDKALDQLAASIRGSAWKRVYLPEALGSTVPPADKLANSVRALDQLEQTRLVLENPVTKKATTFIKNYSISPNFTEELQASEFHTSPIYVFYSQNPGIESKSVEERFADLQRQQMEMMMNMSPEEMAGAMQYGMDQFMNMDPQLRTQMMGNMMRAGMQMFMNMPADQRNQMMQGMGQMFQGIGGGFPGGQPQRRP